MTEKQTASRSPEHVEVLIVGAGISGIDAACHLRMNLPGRSLAILEAMDGFGGTWWTHRYPGARSDSDLYTYAFGFRPWQGRSIATAEEIHSYLGEVIKEYGLDSKIRYGHRVQTVNWSNEHKRWTVEVSRGDTGERFSMTTDFLWLGAGYYDHRQGFTPKWNGFDRYKATVVHPQHWPKDLDYAGKRVIVIGSGATAATLIPALAGTAAHVTMLQRSPTFFTSVPWTHQLDTTLRELNLPEEWRAEILRRAHLKQTFDLINLSSANPDAVRDWLINEIRQQLPEGFDVDKHFNPSYRPWQQRVAAVPEGDLFAAIRDGKASVVTDTIESFDETGITLASGEHLQADIVVTATGFDMSAFGQIAFQIDGDPVDMTKRVSYRGLMIEGIPNMAFIYGYYRSSWTLRADLVCEFTCRVLAHMEKVGAKTVEPRLRAEDADMQRLPWTDPNNFNAGYVMRSQHQMHMRGDRMPWQHHFEYEEERKTIPELSPDAEVLVYR